MGVEVDNLDKLLPIFSFQKATLLSCCSGQEEEKLMKSREK